MSPRRSHLAAPRGRPPDPRPPAPVAGAAAAGPHWWHGLALVALIVLAYAPLGRAGFVWDDDSMLTANPLIRAGNGLAQFWFTRHATDYWPVTSTSLWLEWRLWGLHPLGYHLTNLALHLGATLLLWVLLRRLQVPGAWLAAVIFGVHPLNVESVTWIAQRKNLLAMLFALLSVGWFVRAEEGRTAAGVHPPRRSGTWYWLSLGAFGLAMLSKGSVATLPVVLAGFVRWRRRWQRSDLMRLAPFFAVAGALAAVDIWFQRHGAPEVIRTAGGLERLLGAGAVLWFYLGKSLWPAHLIFVYPAWSIQTTQVRWWLPVAAAGALTALLVALDRRAARATARRPDPPWARATLYAWGYFCVTLVPVLGFTDVYFMKFSLVADHYAHLALIGVAVWLGVTVHRLRALAGPATRTAGTVGLGLAIAALMALTWRQNRMYRDSATLYRTILAANPDCWMAHSNLGEILAAPPDHGPAAQAEFETALRLNPNYAEAHNNLALELERQPQGQARALAEFAAALRCKPNYALAHDNLANLLMRMPGHRAEAIAHYERALAIDPAFAEAHINLGLAWLDDPSQHGAAIAEFTAALRLEPDNADAHNDLGLALAAAPGRTADALAEFAAALHLRPDFAAAETNLAGLLAAQPGRLPEAIPHYERAAALLPHSASAQNDLAVALAQLPGRLPDAVSHLERALQLDPTDPDLHYNLGNQLTKLPGRLPDALSEYAQVLRLNPKYTSAEFNSAVVCLQLARWEEATRHFERVLQLDPGNRPAQAALAQLQTLAH